MGWGGDVWDWWGGEGRGEERLLELLWDRMMWRCEVDAGGVKCGEGESMGRSGLR